MANQEPLGDRLRGQAAHESGKHGRVLNALFGLAGGRLMPTRQAHGELILRDEKWDAKENELSGSVMNRTAEGTTTAHGVEATKLKYIEVAGGKDQRMARLAILELVKLCQMTGKWDELQGVQIPEGINEGLRVSELPVWQKALGQPGSEAVNQTVLAARPDMAVEVIQAAEAKAGFRYADAGPHNRQNLDYLSTLAVEEAINTYVLLGSIGKIDKSFFLEVARLNDKNLSQLLFDRLRTIKSIGEVGVYALGHFAGGASQLAVDAALAPIGERFSTI